MRASGRVSVTPSGAASNGRSLPEPVHKPHRKRTDAKSDHCRSGYVAPLSKGTVWAHLTILVENARYLPRGRRCPGSRSPVLSPEHVEV